MGERLTGDYRRHLDKPYLGHWDVPEGEDLVVTIDHIEREEIKSQRGTDRKPVAHWREQGIKPMILNVTNQKSISRALGSTRYEDWEGKKIALFEGREPKSEDGLALRVRDVAPREEAFFCADCGQAITGRSGKSPRQIANKALTSFGRYLCWDCAIKAKEGADV